MYVSGILKNSFCDGFGVRSVLFVSGCKHNCKNCHNPKSHNPFNGQKMTVDEIVKELTSEGLDVTISGGDPLEFYYDEILEVCKILKQQYCKNIWLYTGYTFEYILQNKKEILKYIDVLVDGKYEEDKSMLKPKFRGSTNQRVIDVYKTMESRVLRENKIILKVE